MYRSSSSSSTRFSDDLHSQSYPSSSSSQSHTIKPIQDAIEQLPTYNPQSYVANKEFNRLRSAESAIHFIPLLVVFCALILWLFSNPVAKLDVLFPFKDDTEERVNKIYNLEPLLRSFKALPVLFVADPNEEVDPEEAQEANLEDTLSEPAPMSTATRSKGTVSAASLLAQARAKSTAKQDGKPPTPVSVVASSQVAASKKKGDAKKRKLVEAVATDENKDMDMEKLGEKFRTFVEKELMSPVVTYIDALKIKAARLSHEAAESKKEAAESKKEAAKSAKEVEKLKKEANKYAAETEVLRNDFERLGKEVETIRAENKAHMKELEVAEGDFTFNATKTLLETRIQMIEEYEKGQASAWNLEYERKVLADHIGEPADEGEVNSVALEALVDDAHKELSTIVATPNDQVEDVTPAAAGQEV